MSNKQKKAPAGMPGALEKGRLNKKNLRFSRSRINSKLGKGLVNALALAALKNDKFLKHLKEVSK